MFKHKISGFCVAAAVFFIPSLAFAHTGHGAASGFFHGFEHPVGGLDHVLAMVLVGMLGFQLGGRALYALPASFVGLMAAGGALGMAGIGIPFVEAGIALSVLVLGLAVAFRASAPLLAAVAVTGVFAVFHGHAHGAEMPADASGLAYGMGFVLATAFLHAAGAGFGFLLARIGEKEGDAVLRLAGGAAAACGLAILAGLV
jgi:urease accessory protein